MEGTVRFFNCAKGLGFITGDDGKEYFVHFSAIDVGPYDFRMLLPGWNVTFRPEQQKDGRWQAKDVQVPDNLPGIGLGEYAAKLKRPLIERGYAPLSVTEYGNLETHGSDARPLVHVDIEGIYLRAYYLGGESVKGFTLSIPRPTENRAFILLDPDKHPMSYRADYQIPRGAYLVQVEADGKDAYVEVFNLGRRYDRDQKENWLVMELRFEHEYGLANVSRESLLAQTPTSGKDRDNDGFVSGIIVGLHQIMDSAVNLPLPDDLIR